MSLPDARQISRSELTRHCGLIARNAIALCPLGTVYETTYDSKYLRSVARFCRRHATCGFKGTGEERIRPHQESGIRISCTAAEATMHSLRARKNAPEPCIHDDAVRGKQYIHLSKLGSVGSRGKIFIFSGPPSAWTTADVLEIIPGISL